MDTTSATEIESDLAQDNMSDDNEQSLDGQRRYSSEEVADIIRLSLSDTARQADNTVDHDELLAIAGEMGVGADDVDRAIELLEEEQLAKDKASYLWSRFRTHCVIFAAANLLFITMNLLSNPGVFWSLYTLFGWGLFLLGHYAGLRYAPQFVELAMERTRSLANSKYQELFDDISNVRFQLTDPMGMSETQGMLSIQGERLVIEHQTLDSMLGLLKGRVKVTEVDIAQLISARLDQKLWNTELVLHGRNMRAFDNAPGANQGCLRLKIDRQSGRAARELVDSLRGMISDQS